MSLRRALFAYILSGLLAVLLLTGFGVMLVARAGLRAQLDAALVARARTFAALVVEEDGGLEFEYDGSIRESDLGAMVRISCEGGRVLAQSPGWPEDAALPSPSASPVAVGFRVGERVLRAVSLAGAASRDPESLDQHDDSGEMSGRSIIVEVIGATQTVRRAESALLTALILGGVFAAGATVLAVWFGIRRGLRPVGGLCDELNAMDARSATLGSAPGDYPEELRPIVVSLDHLLGRLREAMARERRFTDGAAHELRTPIAELRTIAEVAERWPEPERQRRAIGEARSVAEETEALLESLLAAARGGAAFASHRSEPVDLLPIVDAAVERSKESFERRGVACEVGGDAAAAWTGARGAVLALIRNLVDNAAEYTPDGGSIRVRVTEGEAGAVLEVENGPVTLGAADAEKIFEPFWRQDEAREDRVHRGLGLAIVASLAESLGLVHGCEVTSDRRLRVRIGPASWSSVRDMM
jgi:signal transduction histidine kinase